MRPRRIGLALRFCAQALAAVAIAAAAGLIVAPLRAAEQPPCDEAAVATRSEAGQLPPPCEETPTETTTTATTSTTETTPVTEPPPETVTETVPPDDPNEEGVVDLWPPADKAPKNGEEAASDAAKPTGSGNAAGGSRIVRAPLNGTPKLSAGPYVFPVVGPSSYTDTWGAPRATVAWHHGVDIFAPLGAPIVAVADGTLFSVGWNRVGGQRLWLRDRQGNYFYYAHLSAFSSAAVDGARVRAGTVVGYVGNTGDAVGTPYHLHFEIHPVSLLSLGYDGAVNPFPYVSTWLRLDNVFSLAGAWWTDEAAASATRAAAAISAAAPAPGAVLLGVADISSAAELSPASLEQTLEKRPRLRDVAVAAAPLRIPQPSVTAASTIPPPRVDDAQVARALDSEAAQPARYPATVWDALAICESGGDWRANTGNGYVGGLQFLPQTWAAHGGGAFAPSAHLATREQQITVAERVLDTQGWRAWPACSAMLGLRAPDE